MNRLKTLLAPGIPLLLFLVGTFSHSFAQKEPSPGGGFISWSAELQGKAESPAVRTHASATASFQFDFDKQVATVTITGDNLLDVSRIELRKETARQGMKGPMVVTLYNATTDGQLPATYTKNFTGDRFSEIAEIVSNDLGVVEIFTKSHPKGELIGEVKMHKSS